MTPGRPGLARSVGTIGGLTAISRVFGFARDMLLARLLGAGLAADAFQLAFVLPNTFRRLFAEGAFSVAFVPMYAKALHGPGGEDEAARFADGVLSIFVWVLVAVSVLAMLAMPGIVWLLAADFRSVPGKYELSVTLARIAFPYLAAISLVAMLSGVLNARSRFAPGAIVPLLLNLVLIAGISAGYRLRAVGENDIAIAHALAIAVTLAGGAQLTFLIWAVRRAGLLPRLSAPRLSPEVRALAARIVPAILGAGIYQASQFVDTFFATSLPQGSLTLLRYADRLVQMPLGVVGVALGTAILPELARRVHAGERHAAWRLQRDAVELACLLTLPAAAALWVCAPAFVTALFVGGRFTLGDGAVMTGIVVALVAGLPAYVLVKVLQPAFFSRDDVRTPMLVTAVALLVNIAANIVVVPRYGIVGLAGTTAGCALLNVVTLAVLLHARGWFRLDPALVTTVARQAVATAVMVGVLAALLPEVAAQCSGGVIARAVALAALVGTGLASFLVAALATGALDKARLTALVRGRRRDAPAQP